MYVFVVYRIFFHCFVFEIKKIEIILKIGQSFQFVREKHVLLPCIVFALNEIKMPPKSARFGTKTWSKVKPIVHGSITVYIYGLIWLMTIYFQFILIWLAVDQSVGRLVGVCVFV